MLEHLCPTPRSPRRVVVLGAGGFIGRTIVARLVRARIEVLPLTRRELDLTVVSASATLCRYLEPSDALVVVSAVAPARTAAMMMTNLRMGEQICLSLAESEVDHVLYISSDAVYCDEANPVTEYSATAPTTFHGMMHAAREMMLERSARAPFVALRPTLVYGAGDPHNGYGPNRFRRQAQQGQPVCIFGDGEEQRDHVTVEDVAALAVLVLEHRSMGALNVATGVSTSFHQIARFVADQFRVAVESQPRPGPRPHLLHRFFDVSNVHTAFPKFGFTALADGLEAARRAEAGER